MTIPPIDRSFSIVELVCHACPGQTVHASPPALRSVRSSLRFSNRPAIQRPARDRAQSKHLSTPLVTTIGGETAHFHQSSLDSPRRNIELCPSIEARRATAGSELHPDGHLSKLSEFEQQQRTFSVPKAEASHRERLDEHPRLLAIAALLTNEE